MLKGMRFSRRKFLMKKLTATKTLRLTEEQKLRLLSASMRAMVVATDIYNQLPISEVISIVSLRYIRGYNGVINSSDN